jgi:glutathione S-transferase
MYTLYDYWESGNYYKVRLLLNQVEIAYQRIPVDILSGETRTSEFWQRTPIIVCHCSLPHKVEVWLSRTRSST